MLVEFHNAQSVASLQSVANHFPNEQRIAMKTRFLHFSDRNHKDCNVRKYEDIMHTEEVFKEADFIRALSKANDVSDSQP